MTDLHNPLLHRERIGPDTPPFGQIRTEHFMPAFDFALQKAQAEVEEIAGSGSEPTFEHTIEALERCGEELQEVTTIFFALNAAETSPEMQKAALEMVPRLTAYANSIKLNPYLYERVKAVYDRRGELSLEPEQHMLLEETYKGFVRGGAGLKHADKEAYRSMSEELSSLTTLFGQNVLAETNAFTVNIAPAEEAIVAELPEFVREGMAAEAGERGEEGWTVTLQAASMMPFMTYSSNRGIKERLWRRYGSRGMGGEHDNRRILVRISELRSGIARLLGYRTYADYVLEECMAKSVKCVNGFLEELLDATIDYARRDYGMVQDFARNRLGDPEFTLMPWDWAYYSEKYKNENYALNDEEIKPYLELESVKQGIFTLAGMLYGIRFKRNDSAEVYQKDVIAYDVTEENGDFIGILYMDFFPRTTKNGGAWMTNFREMYTSPDGREVRPLVAMCCNFTKPTPSAPSLLTFGEFETFLHEFGHCLHGLLAKGRYASLTGTNVRRDFVELPSQLMENWAVERKFLDMFARHYQTGEPIPSELTDKIAAARNYLAAYLNVRQLSFAISDMAWHTLTPPTAEEVEAFEKATTERARILPAIESTAHSPAFTHIFSGGYAAGYYSYKWSEVLDADAFSLFREMGIFSREAGDKFRKCILEKGGSEEPMKLYVDFRGHEPQTKALIDRMDLR